ncbi:MAG: alpha/beta fold hydrolase [Micromonosporaceae bacterium]|nr:alpha/beta fold hydrolase [Micromonosporaceae bacterium]
MATSTEITRKDGRRVAAHFPAEGRSGRTVVLCHAAPGSGGFDPDPEQTAARDVTLLGVDRPGYGGSEPMPAEDWASVAVAADDLAEVLDQLGTGPVGVAGWSAGGRVALALAARRPDLVTRVAVLATPAPDDAVAWVPPEHKAALEAMRGQPAAQVHAALGEQLAGFQAGDPAQALALLGAEAADEPVLARPGARQRLTELLSAAFAQGVVGLAADIAGYSLQPWGFEPAEVTAKTLLLYGADDPVAGPAHGRWYRRQLPDARYEQVPAAGHLLVIPMWRRVLSHLAPNPR